MMKGMMKSGNSPELIKPTHNAVVHRAIDQFDTFVAPDRRASYQRAVSTKNPLALSTFEERGVAIGAKLERVRNSQTYKGMSPEQQAQIRANLYDKYVAPSYANSGLRVPDKAMWVEMSKTNKNFMGSDDVNSQMNNAGVGTIANFVGGVDKGFTGVEIFGLKVANKTFQALHGMDSLFSANLSENFKKADTNVEKVLQHQIAVEQHHNDSVDFWLNTHYRDSLLNGVAHWTGEQVAAAPIYSAVGKALGIADTSSLSKALVSTKYGKVVYESIKGATDGFVGALVTSGGDVHEGKVNAIGGAVLGPVASKVGEKIASNALIKKWTGQILAKSGKPFVQDLAASAHHEETAISQHLLETGEHTPDKTIHFGNGISLTHTDENSGHITFQGVNHPYKTPQERQELMNKIITLHSQIRMHEDPLNEELHKAEKKAQNSIAQSLYGKPLSRLNKEQANRVFMKRQALIDQAAFEVPVHNPEEVKVEVQNELQEAYKTNPELAKRGAEIEKKYGVSIAGTVAEKNIENVALETGIKDKGATAEKIAKKIPKVKTPEVEYEPPDGASAFMNYRKQNLVYFKNPSNVKNLIKDEGLGMTEATYRARQAADGTVVGARDQRSWDKILTDERRQRFIDQLKKADGGAIKFESPMHQMLFHFAGRNEFSPALKAKFLREMKSMPGYENWNTKDFDKAADWTMLHVYELAKSGRLASEGNMFASTKIEGPTAKWTTWQFDLANENDLDQIKLISDGLKRWPQVKKQTMNIVKSITDMKYHAKTVDDYIKFDQELSNVAAAAARQAGN